MWEPWLLIAQTIYREIVSYAWATIVSPEDCNTTDTQQSSYWGGRPSATRNCDFAYRAPLGHTIKSEKPWSEKRQSETTTLRAYSR